MELAVAGGNRTWHYESHRAADQPAGGGLPETSANWRMPALRLRGDAGTVEVRIWFDQTDPPVGHLRPCVDSGASSDGNAGPIQFSGWLGLLRALSDALGGLDDIPRAP